MTASCSGDTAITRYIRDAVVKTASAEKSSIAEASVLWASEFRIAASRGRLLRELQVDPACYLRKVEDALAEIGADRMAMIVGGARSNLSVNPSRGDLALVAITLEDLVLEAKGLVDECIHNYAAKSLKIMPPRHS